MSEDQHTDRPVTRSIMLSKQGTGDVEWTMPRDGYIKFVTISFGCRGAAASAHGHAMLRIGPGQSWTAPPLPAELHLQSDVLAYVNSVGFFSNAYPTTAIPTGPINFRVSAGQKLIFRIYDLNGNGLGVCLIHYETRDELFDVLDEEEISQLETPIDR